MMDEEMGIRLLVIQEHEGISREYTTTLDILNTSVITIKKLRGPCMGPAKPDPSVTQV